jgi:hypothetical protein
VAEINKVKDISIDLTLEDINILECGLIGWMSEFYCGGDTSKEDLVIDKLGRIKKRLLESTHKDDTL